MKSGFNLLWSDRALEDLQNIISHLTKNWTQKEIKKFFRKLDKRLEFIQENPKLFPITRRRGNIRRSVLTPQTTIYYQASRNVVTIIALFDNRQNPSKLKL